MNKAKEMLLDGSAWVVGAVLIGAEKAGAVALYDLKVPVGLYLVTIMVAAYFGISVGTESVKTRMHREAVRAGAAQWVVDEDGKVKFRWRE